MSRIAACALVMVLAVGTAHAGTAPPPNPTAPPWSTTTPANVGKVPISGGVSARAVILRADPANGKVSLRNDMYHGVSVARLYQLDFWSFAADVVQATPYVNLIVTWSLDTGPFTGEFSDTLVFDPTNQPGFAVNTWQHWNAADPTAVWYSTRDPLMGPTNPGPLAPYVARHPKAKLTNLSSDGPGLAFIVGDSVNTSDRIGYIDKVTIAAGIYASRFWEF